MKGLILINAYSTDEEYLYQPYRLKEEFANLRVEIDILRNDFFPFVLEGNKIVSSLKQYDFVIYLDKDKYILNTLANSGVPLFNPSEAISQCDDKMITYLALSNKNIPMPKTLPGLLCYDQAELLKLSTIERIEKELSYPLIIKESYGSKGKGVFLIKNRNQLIEKMEDVKCKPHLFQQYIDSSFGKDVRVIVINKKVVGAMQRSSKNDFRSNLGNGGIGSEFPLTSNLVELSIKIAEILSLDYCGIDFLFGKEGNFILCEVNSNAFFFGFEHATGINVAKIYATFVLDRLK